MTDHDAVKSLEARVTRLEAALAQSASGAAAAPHVPVYADPPPLPVYGGWGGYRPFPYPIHWPIGDPAPVDYTRVYADPGPYGTTGGGGYRYPVHRPIGDPAPVDYTRIYADPGPFGTGGGVYRYPVHRPIGDPPPIDYSSLPAEQLEATLHSINAEKARLSSLEAQVTQHLEKHKAKKS